MLNSFTREESRCAQFNNKPAYHGAGIWKSDTREWCYVCLHIEVPFVEVKMEETALIPTRANYEI